MLGCVPSAVPSTAFSFARPYWTPGSRHTPLLLQSLFLVKGFYRTSYYLTARDGVLNKDWVHGGASFQQRSNSLLVHAVRSNPVQWIVYPGIWTNQKSTSNTLLPFKPQCKTEPTSLPRSCYLYRSSQKSLPSIVDGKMTLVIQNPSRYSHLILIRCRHVFFLYFCLPNILLGMSLNCPSLYCS